MLPHPSLEEFEQKLTRILAEIDDLLENRYGHLYPLHPSRPKRGETASKAHDGLFNLSTSFTLGLGSKLGKGYVFDLHFATLEKVEPAVLRETEKLVLEQLNQKLDRYFPNRKLDASRDGKLIKIHGDLSLGKL